MIKIMNPKSQVRILLVVALLRLVVPLLLVQVVLQRRERHQAALVLPQVPDVLLLLDPPVLPRLLPAALHLLRAQLLLRLAPVHHLQLHVRQLRVHLHRVDLLELRVHLDRLARDVRRDERQRLLQVRVQLIHHRVGVIQMRNLLRRPYKLLIRTLQSLNLRYSLILCLLALLLFQHVLYRRIQELMVLEVVVILLFLLYVPQLFAVPL